jgi:AraC family transcriptional regulator of adaptative response/methylated-DNA-[protein]-cysteine methyltransferase
MNDYEKIEKVIRHVKDHYIEQPDLHALSRIAGVSEFHFHRLFSRWAGVTPKALVKFSHGETCESAAPGISERARRFSRLGSLRA